MNKRYALLSTRIKAAVIDGIVLILLIYLATELLSLFESVPSYIRISIFIFIFILYEPLLISVFGATVGHFFNDIVVKNANNEKRNISFPLAVVRFLLKITLGWLSLITISGSKKGQAIHDSAAYSVVLPYKQVKP